MPICNNIAFELAAFFINPARVKLDEIETKRLVLQHIQAQLQEQIQSRYFKRIY
jgi:hypothetical protein